MKQKGIMGDMLVIVAASFFMITIAVIFFIIVNYESIAFGTKTDEVGGVGYSTHVVTLKTILDTPMTYAFKENGKPIQIESTIGELLMILAEHHCPDPLDFNTEMIPPVGKIVDQVHLFYLYSLLNARIDELLMSDPKVGDSYLGYSTSSRSCKIFFGFDPSDTNALYNAERAFEKGSYESIALPFSQSFPRETLTISLYH